MFSNKNVASPVWMNPDPLLLDPNQNMPSVASPMWARVPVTVLSFKLTYPCVHSSDDDGRDDVVPPDGAVFAYVMAAMVWSEVELTSIVMYSGEDDVNIEVLIAGDCKTIQE